MAASTVTFTGPGGADPVEHILRLVAAATPTIGDALWAGQFLRSRIRNRTSEGIDAQGVHFAPYSERYRKSKAKKLGHANVVDLFGAEHHPHMLNSIEVRAGSHIVAGADLRELAASDDPEACHLFEIGFWDEEAALKARVHDQGLGTAPVRNFFDASDDDRMLMEDGIGARGQQRLDALPH